MKNRQKVVFILRGPLFLNFKFQGFQISLRKRLKFEILEI
jgi:hypothetical protein